MTTQPRDDDWEALARHLAGEGSPAAAERVRKLLSEDPARSVMLDALAAMSRSVGPSAPPVDVDAAWAGVRARLPATDAPSVAPAHIRPARRTGWWIAAGLAAALGAVVLWRGSRPAPVPATIVATAVGARDSVVFADGSRILLAPASRLEFAAAAGARPAIVQLTGEAYFDLPHDPARPFRVLAGGAEISDIGTRFTVRQTATGSTIVDVHTGSVGLAADGAEPLVLAAGDRGIHRGAESPALLHGAAPAEPPAWTDGRLEFRDAELTRVAEELGRWYGMQLTVVDPGLAGRHLTATFAGEPREEVARIIALSLGATAAWRGDTLVLEAGPAR